MSLLDAAREEMPERDGWYCCPTTGCTYRTKQRKGLPQVAHNCPVKRALVNLREET